MKNMTITPPEGQEFDQDSIKFENGAFTIGLKQKESLPMSWEEYCGMNPDKVIEGKDKSTKVPFRFYAAPREYIALRKLELLRDAWGGRNAKIEGNQFLGVPVDHPNNRFSVYLLTFKTTELRDKFQSTFSDLIEEAKELL